MNAALLTPQTTTDAPARPDLAVTAPERPSDRVYARAFSLAVLGLDVETATRELIELAEGNPHVLGQARDRCVRLARTHTDSELADRALIVVTHAWLSAIAAA